MSDELVPHKRLRAGDADRDSALTALQRAHAEGRLTVEELGERQDAALQARFTDELGGLLDDLPEGVELATRPGSALWRPPSAAAPTVGGESPSFTFTVMTGREIDVAPGTALYRNFAWWGGDVMDLRSVMGPGVVVVLELHAVMGGHTIHVPRGVRVLDESNRLLMSTNDVEPAAQGDGSNGTLVLRGTQILSGSAVRLGARPRR